MWEKFLVALERKVVLVLVWERKHMCVTNFHKMTLAVEVALNPNTTNQIKNDALSTQQNLDGWLYNQ